MVPFGDFHIFFNLNSVPGQQAEGRVVHYTHMCVDARVPVGLTLHPLLVWSDSGTFNSNIVLCNSFSTLNGHCSRPGRGGKGREEVELI